MTSSNAMRPILVAGLMVLSSLAGCISTDDANTDDTSNIIDDTTTPVEPVIFGNVMVSTYHVGELAKAVGGDNIVVEYMSQENIPVHDYEPSLTDLVRLQNSDLFLYHGLDLEPWVESTLSSMENAPPHYMTHTMPVGEATVDYDSFLVSNLCDLMLEGPFESVTMGMIHDDHDDHDDHEPPRYSQVFHDLDIYGTGDLYDLTVTVHFDEDAKYNDDGDLVALMEERVNFTVVYEFDRELAGGNTGVVFANMESTSVGPLGQSAGGSPVSSSHTERTYFQSHMAEYGTGPIGAEEGINSIEITITARDDPNNNPLVLDDGVVEFDFNIIWVEQDDHGDDHDDHGDHGHAEAEKEFVNPENCPADTTIQVFHMGAGEHVLEFESEHDEDFNMAVLKMLGGHAHHDHHGEDHGEDHGDEDGHGDHDDHDEGYCHNLDTHENYESTEEDCANAGHMWTEGEGHDDHEGGMCHNTATHENYESTEADCATAGHVWMDNEHHDHNLPEIHANRVVHTLSFPEHMVCYDISTHTVNHTYDNEAECEAANMMWTAADSGSSDDDHDDHSDEEDNHDDHSHEEEHHEFGFVVIHIEEEGDYGFALPSDIEMFILMGEGGHENHDDHDDDMVCYDMSTHTVDSSITAEEDCEAAGLMWTAANSGPGGDDDHDEDHEGDGNDEIDAGEDEEAFEYLSLIHI